MFSGKIVNIFGESVIMFRISRANNLQQFSTCHYSGFCKLYCCPVEIMMNSIQLGHGVRAYH